jgi:hypothetical protein
MLVSYYIHSISNYVLTFVERRGRPLANRFNASSSKKIRKSLFLWTGGGGPLANRFKASSSDNLFVTWFVDVDQGSKLSGTDT